MSNPFIYDPPVRGKEFVNREAELQTLFNRLRIGQSPAVMGKMHVRFLGLLALRWQIFLRRRETQIGVGVFLALLLLIGVFGLGGNILALGIKEYGPMAYLATQTPTPTFTFTPTFIPTLLTNTSTPTLTHSLSNKPTITPTPNPLSVSLVDNFGVTMRLVPAGTFAIGSKNGYDDEFPAHPVSLDNFYIDQYEVTNGFYAACVDAGICKERNGSELRDTDFAQYPVRNVNWYDAQTYCKWREARLPTEAEWEKAARGGLEGMDYPWGDEYPGCSVGSENGAQFNDCAGQTVPVGQFAPNGYGLFDMAGNVWEWAADWYDSGYYAVSQEKAPAGPETGDYRVLRGGSWLDDPFDIRAADRHGFPPDHARDFIGFRCTRSP